MERIQNHYYTLFYYVEDRMSMVKPEQGSHFKYLSLALRWNF